MEYKLKSSIRSCSLTYEEDSFFKVKTGLGSSREHEILLDMRRKLIA